MAHTVIPHTQNQPTHIHLTTLPTPVQQHFTTLMDQADQAAEHRELTAYHLLHTQAAALIGIRPPASGELARCTWEGCWNCDTVFDADQARYYTSLTVEFVQCPACADDHRITSD